MSMGGGSLGEATEVLEQPWQGHWNKLALIRSLLASLEMWDVLPVVLLCLRSACTCMRGELCLSLQRAQQQQRKKAVSPFKGINRTKVLLQPRVVLLYEAVLHCGFTIRVMLQGDFWSPLNNTKVLESPSLEAFSGHLDVSLGNSL